MKRVPADEFARHAAEYLEGSEPVSLEKDGEIIGQYVPTPNGHAVNGLNADDAEEDRRRKKAEARAAFERLQHVLQGIYARTVELLDPGKPFPYDLDPNQ
jgi:hypothetical protein